jgi:hypothetical protein
VPDIPALLIRGHEPEYLQWFFQHFAYNPDAIAPSDIAEYVCAIQQPGALRAGLAIYEDCSASAAQVARHTEQPLDIPVVGFGGDACLGGLTLPASRQSRRKPPAGWWNTPATGCPRNVRTSLSSRRSSWRGRPTKSDTGSLTGLFHRSARPSAHDRVAQVQHAIALEGVVGIGEEHRAGVAAEEAHPFTQDTGTTSIATSSTSPAENACPPRSPAVTRRSQRTEQPGRLTEQTAHLGAAVGLVPLCQRPVAHLLDPDRPYERGEPRRRRVLHVGRLPGHLAILPTRGPGPPVGSVSGGCGRQRRERTLA